jgi:glycosyltransferase involved in cell wall biosynthesis
MKKTKLSVAMVAPPFGDTGGPEIVTQNLADSLVKLGVDVTLFAPGDWKTDVKHVVTLEKSIQNMKKEDKGNIEELRIDSQTEVIQYAENFDVVHFHSQREAAIVAEKITAPCVLSFHNRIKKEEFAECAKAGLYTVALSNSQKGKLAVSAMIYNGVPVQEIDYSFEKGGYLMFIGRFSDQKGIDTAIELAIRAKKKLLIFGRIGNTKERKDFFQKKIEPFLDDENVIYKGEVTHAEIYEYLRGASALLFPIRRSEVCPMVVAEALSCGTPIIGTRVAPLPELLNDASVAFLSDDVEELVDALKNIERFDRKACREYAEKNFDSLVMAKKYLELYESIRDK